MFEVNPLNKGPYLKMLFIFPNNFDSAKKIWTISYDWVFEFYNSDAQKQSYGWLKIVGFIANYTWIYHTRQ